MLLNMIKNTEKTPCQKVNYYLPDGTPVYVKKAAYDTDKDAIEAARRLNLNVQQIHKAVAYKCPKCHKWHVGRNRTVLTDKDRKHYRDIKTDYDRKRERRTCQTFRELVF